jgi:hypothetical protein
MNAKGKKMISLQLSSEEASKLSSILFEKQQAVAERINDLYQTKNYAGESVQETWAGELTELERICSDYTFMLKRLNEQIEHNRNVQKEAET